MMRPRRTHPLQMVSSRRRKPREPEQPHEYCAASGFSWTIEYPERGAALGYKKPLAKITLPDHDPVFVPVAVARSLESQEHEPQCAAELFYDIKERSTACAWSRLIDMVSRREHSSKEIASKLRNEGYSATAADSAVEKGVELRLVNDARFAESFIRMKLACGWGPVRLERELANRGIALREVSGWPEDFLEDDDVQERAMRLLSSKRIPEKNAYPKLVRFLASRGYPLSVCKEAVSRRLSDEEEAF